MSSSIDINHIVNSSFVRAQGPNASRKYMAFASTYALRLAMEMVTSNQVQEVAAERRQTDNENEVQIVANSSVSDILDAVNVESTRVSVDYDRADQAGNQFPWNNVRSLLAQPSTVYDLPIQRLVVRFDNDDFTQMWEKKIKNAISDPNFPTGWIDTPFYAVLKSANPGNDGRKKVKNDHKDRYFLPKSNTSSSGERGLGWTPRVLNLSHVWSQKGWTGGSDPQLEAWSGRQGGGNWTAKRIEQRLMNFFEPELKYTGMLRDDALMNEWRSVMSNNNSRNYTSYKVFEWENEDEWMLQ